MPLKKSQTVGRWVRLAVIIRPGKETRRDYRFYPQYLVCSLSSAANDCTPHGAQRFGRMRLRDPTCPDISWTASQSIYQGKHDEDTNTLLRGVTPQVPIKHESNHYGEFDRPSITSVGLTRPC
jgi:hypothetical protein